MVHLYLQSLPGPELRSEGESVELEDSATFVFFGAGTWWYPSRALGLHLEARVGAAQFETNTEEAEQVDVGTTGVGLTAGGGYDFWLSREWSLGVSARLFTAGMSGTTRQTIQGLQARRTEFDFVLSGALLVGVQYH
jgi:hypothetical protein